MLIAMDEVQTAVYEALIAANLGCDVRDEWLAGERKKAPYVCLSAFLERSDDTKTEGGSAVWVRTHVWMSSGTRKPALAIVQKIKDALHGKTLPVNGYTMTSCRHEDTKASGGPGKAGQFVSTYKILVTEAPA